MSALSERIAKANREKLSTREVVRRAEKAGLRVSHGTIANILKGSHGTPSDNTLRALESVFRVPFGELRQLVGLAATDEAWTPPADAARLSPTQRRLIESLIHELARPEADKGILKKGRATPITSRRRPSPRS